MAGKTHQSLLSYSIVRPYPFRWITPAVAVGVVVLTVLFSFLNFASTGFNLVVELSSDPKATISGAVWFRHWQSYVSHNVQPTCQAANIPINTRFFTNQTALTYTLAGVWQHNDSGVSILPSLSYFNNVLQTCSITSIDIDMAAIDRTANQFAYAEWGETVRSYITCAIHNSNGTTLFNLTQEYDYVPADVPMTSLVVGRIAAVNILGHISGQLQIIRENQTSYEQPGIRKGTIALTRNPGVPSDITNQEFFNVDFRFIIDLGYGSFDVILPGDYNQSNSVSALVSQKAYPNIWHYASSLAKSAWSTILVDLGQTSNNSSILTDGATLQSFTEVFSDPPFMANAHPGPATEDYENSIATSGPLGTTASVISTEYLCQVPRRKSDGNLFVSVLVADLVFLQTSWLLFKLATDYFILKKIPGAQHCEGCASRLEDEPEQKNVGRDRYRSGGSASEGLLGITKRFSRVSSLQVPQSTQRPGEEYSSHPLELTDLNHR